VLIWANSCHVAVDLTPFYPTSLKPQFLLDLRSWYITTYKDRFFVHPPAFFTTYVVLEAVYHLPLSIWAIRAILRGKFFPAKISPTVFRYWELMPGRRLAGELSVEMLRSERLC
jgi:EXPERA (EXPanded EBP superfamily)